MVLLKLNSKKGSDKAVPDQLPALPSHAAKPDNTQAVPDKLPDLNKAVATTQPQEQPQQPTTQPQAIQPQQATPQATNQTQPQEQPQQATNQTQPTQQPQQVTQPQEPITQPIQQATQPQQPTPQATNQTQQNVVTDNTSFFSRLQSLTDIDESENNKKEKFKSLLEKDLFDTLEEFHESVDAGKTFVLHKDEIKSIIHTKLEQLKSIENNWHAKKEQLKALQSQVDKDEIKLKDELKELKELMNTYTENKIEKDKHFYLNGNESISSISELKKKLPSISDDVFNHHVTGHRNDFANWIEHVFNYKSLADKIRPARSKEELIKLLE